MYTTMTTMIRMRTERTMSPVSAIRIRCRSFNPICIDENTEYLKYDEDSVDTDMLPTMLIYHNGELVYNWVRVDWEAGGAGVEELLVK
jgi:hypothetical protein